MMLTFLIVFYYVIVWGRCMSLHWVDGGGEESEFSNTWAAVCESQSAKKGGKNNKIILKNNKMQHDEWTRKSNFLQRTGLKKKSLSEGQCKASVGTYDAWMQFAYADAEEKFSLQKGLCKMSCIIVGPNQNTIWEVFVIQWDGCIVQCWFLYFYFLFLLIYFIFF